MSSTDLEGAVWAREIGKSAKARIKAIGEMVHNERFVIARLLRDCVPLSSGFSSGLELLPVNHDAPFEASNRPAVLHRRHVDHHLIAGFERRLGPPGVLSLDRVLPST